MKITKRQKHEWLTAYIMASPLVIGIFVFYFAPTIWTVYMSLTEGNDYLNYQFVGLKNFNILFTEIKDFGTFYFEIINTFYYAFISVILSMFFSVFFANLLNQKIKCKSLFRLIYFLPCLTMAPAVGIVWRNLLNSKIGLINIALSKIGIAGPAWLSDLNFIMIGVIIVGVWSSVGYNMILILAGLQNIPKVYYEAAKIDGANSLNVFFRITIPLLSPVLFFVSITSVMSGFKMFDLMYTMSNASVAPSSILLYYRTMVYGIYEKGFLYNNFGSASAEAVILLSIILVLTLIQIKMQKKWVHYS